MSVKIRLSRTGTTNSPSYRIVVTDENKKRDGKVIEIIGNYNPLSNPPKLTVNKQRAQFWISKGAKATKTASALLRK